MTKSTITRERIEQYANDPRMCNINDEIRQMARMALAAMDSEPVVPVVPDELPWEYLRGWPFTYSDYAKGWNACRSAMLAAYPQSPGSEQAAVPGKWIPVSERMPDDDDFVYIWPRPDFGVELHVGQYCECSPKGDGWYAQVYEQNYGIEWHPITVTHWMPLLNPPKEEK